MDSIATPGIFYSKSRIYPETPITPFFDLGNNQPPANSLRLPTEREASPAPLCLAWNDNSKCPELTYSVDPDYLFSNYLWVSGSSATAMEYSKYFYKQVEQRLPSQAPRIAYEVASNDGTFLKQFQNRGFQVLGIDPAKNIVEVAIQNGVPSIPEFFSPDTIKKHSEMIGKAGCTIARNVLPHVNNPRQILEGISLTLQEHGIAVIEFHHSSKILEELHYDSIYHEHIFYFPITTVVKLMVEIGLFPFDLSWSPISGGSAVIYASKSPKVISNQLLEQIEKEKNSGVLTFEAWKKFADESRNHAIKLSNLVKEFRKQGEIIGYGASARSSTMLNFAGLNSKDISLIADQSHYKHGKLAAGSNILILPPEVALSRNPSTILLLAWNFKEEIIALLNEKYRFKGHIIIPLPNDPTIIKLN